MADEKLTALANLATPISTDIVYVVDDPAGAPLSRKASIENLLKTDIFEGFRAQLNGDQNIPNGVATQLQFSVEDFDYGSNFDTGNYRWTPPAGIVLIGIFLCWNNVNGAGGNITRLYKNGAQMAFTIDRSQTTSAATGTSPLVLIDLADGDDYYEVFAEQWDGAGKNVIDDLGTKFWGCVIGKWTT